MPRSVLLESPCVRNIRRVDNVTVMGAGLVKIMPCHRGPTLSRVPVILCCHTKREQLPVVVDGRKLGEAYHREFHSK